MSSSAEGLAHKLEEGAVSYGATGVSEVEKDLYAAKKKVGLLFVVACVFVPWITFLINFWAMSFTLRYWFSGLAYAIVILTGLCCAYIGIMAIQATRGNGGDPLWLGCMFALTAIGWSWGYVGGNWNYLDYSQPYYDLNQLNVYETVDPTTSRGNQYMDVGIMTFNASARVDRNFSMSFKNEDTYCVAPITVPNATPGVYDFWAVGKNCCNQNLFDFQCGEYNNPLAHTGVRIMDASAEQLFQIVVKQAQAAYNLSTAHPMMFTWVSNPSDVVNSYQDEAVRHFIREAFYWFCIDVALVVLFAIAFSKL